jgi:hypothetical protein
MAYNPNMSFNYSPAGGQGFGLNPLTGEYVFGYGNMAGDIGGRPANPMQSSLYTNYYSPVPQKSLWDTVQAMHAAKSLTAPRGYDSYLEAGKQSWSGAPGSVRTITMG